MMTVGSFRATVLAAVAMFVVTPGGAWAQSPPAQQEKVAEGQRDFDFLFGTWKVHLKKLAKPLSGDKTWVEFEGTATHRKVWDGRANMDEFRAIDPITKNEIVGLTVRLFNPKTGEWSLYWANARDGKIAMPPTVGKFKNGRGEFYDMEEWNGRTILVRYVWSDITANSAHFEQAFSTDGGKTWEVNWITDQERISQ